MKKKKEYEWNWNVLNRNLFNNTNLFPCWIDFKCVR